MAAFTNAGEVSWGFQFMLNHWPPKVLTTVSRAAMLSPQPARPRRQIPDVLPGWLSLAAKVWICAQVGCCGMVSPALANKVLL